MGKRGAAPTQLSSLMSWEAIWYHVFDGLLGRATSEKPLVRGRMTARLRGQVQALQEALGEVPEAKSFAQCDWVALQRSMLKREESAIRRESELAEPDVWKALVRARSAEEVRQACRQSRRWLNPEWGGALLVDSRGRSWSGRPFVELLFNNADRFLRAKNHDPFYPRAYRLSSDAKRTLFFIRAMAGISCRVSPSTAVGLLRKVKHGTKCPCVKCSIETSDGFYKLMYAELQQEKKGRPARITRAYFCPDRCGYQSQSKNQMMTHVRKRHGWRPHDLVMTEYLEWKTSSSRKKGR